MQQQYIIQLVELKTVVKAEVMAIMSSCLYHIHVHLSSFSRLMTFAVIILCVHNIYQCEALQMLKTVKQSVLQLACKH